MQALEINQLRKNMPKLKLDIANLEIAPGEIAVLLGGPKSGKSTLFKLLLNMIFPDFGSIHVFGLDSRQDSEAVKEHLGAVLRRPGFLYNATLKQLKQMYRPFFPHWDEDAYKYYMSDFELIDSMVYGRIDNSSKKMFVICLALSRRPGLLLLDEPFTQVNAFAKEHIAQALWQEQREHGLAFLVTTPDPIEAGRLANTIHILDHGSLLVSLPDEQLAEAAAELDWSSLPKRSSKETTARKIAQVEALFNHYTRKGGGEE